MIRRAAPATALLAAALTATYGLELAAGGDAVCAAWGLTPARATLATAVTSLFLHDPSTLWHLAGNLAFLVVFGVIVERNR
jgi:membrane associated rhomboid family serine protease